MNKNSYRKMFMLIMVSLFSISLAAEETLVSCNYVVDEEVLKEHVSYLVLRDGDRLFSRYRESESREFTVTDDIIYRFYDGDKLSELKAEGKVAPVAESLDISEDKINSLTFYGIDQLDSEEGDGEKFNMVLWKVKSALGTWIGAVAQTDQGLYHRCASRRGFFFLFK